MAQVGVDLPSDLKQHVEARAADGGFGDSAAYLRALAEQGRVTYRADVARVQALIDEGLASGICEKDAFELLDEIIVGIRRPHA